ncbi:MAG TPA: hypothetical protein VMG82_34645 [Candidatus Sulfotelmatobacter sp.]|nr:hypothetical protein [Candidatus Sulfotelmatobacter sp.]
MGGYQRFRIGDGPNAKYVWAKSLQEAQQRWQGSQLRRADPGWDVYLVGHGYSLEHYHRPDNYAPHPPRQRLQVPEGITVLFYVPPGGMLDDAVEDQVVGRDGGEQLAYEPIEVPKGNPNQVAEHILVFPSLRTGFHLPEMIQIMKFGFFLNLQTRAMNPDLAPLRFIAPLRDKCALYVGNRKPQVPETTAIRRNLYLGNYAYLSDILTLIARQHTPIRVHWLACRADYPQASRKFYAQASGTFGVFSDFDNVDLREETLGQALG